MSADDRLAPYACRPSDSRGRLVDEPESPTRSVHQRDRDRIIHSGAFRKLEYKTQVFVYHVGDYFRTRLTHTLEVAQITRSICRHLRLNEDLAEAVALAHDLGHTPFGHAGEDALNDEMAPFGGFQHNDQTVRVLTNLEQRYAAFDGLNLTWETLEGVVKHNGPLIDRSDAGMPAHEALSPAIADLQKAWDLEPGHFPSLEAQVAALADDIAYLNHDIDDGLRAALFSLADLETVPLIADLLGETRRRYPGLERRRLVHELVRRLIDGMVGDLLAETQTRLARLNPASPAGIRSADQPMAAFSAERRHGLESMRAFLFVRMYRHYQVNRETSKARRIVRDLFRLFNHEPNTLPIEWQQGAVNGPPDQRARIVADYIAGMTDRYAILEHRRLFEIRADM